MPSNRTRRPAVRPRPAAVRRIVLMGSMGVAMALPPGLNTVWGYTPGVAQMREVIGLFAHDRRLITDELIESVSGIRGLVQNLRTHIGGDLTLADLAGHRATLLQGPRFVGTATEVYDYLRLLWARVGRTYCPGAGHGRCGREIRPDTVQSAADAVFRLPSGTRLMVGFPLPRSARLTHALVLENLRALGFVRVLADDVAVRLDYWLVTRPESLRRPAVSLLVAELRAGLPVTA